MTATQQAIGRTPDPESGHFRVTQPESGHWHFRDTQLESGHFRVTQPESGHIRVTQPETARSQATSGSPSRSQATSESPSRSPATSESSSRSQAPARLLIAATGAVAHTTRSQATPESAWPDPAVRPPSAAAAGQHNLTGPGRVRRPTCPAACRLCPGPARRLGSVRSGGPPLRGLTNYWVMFWGAGNVRYDRVGSRRSVRVGETRIDWRSGLDNPSKNRELKR